MAEQEKKQTAAPAENTKPADKQDAKKDEKPAEKPQTKAKNDIMGDGSDDGDLILANERVSIPLTPENAKFSRSGGDLISLDIVNADGEEEHFERVILLRSFPVTNPNEFLSVREPDTRKKGRGAEIGMMDANMAAKIMYADEAASVQAQKAAEYKELQSGAESAAARGYVDTVIAPADTRKYVIGAFEMLFTKRQDSPDKKHGTV